MEAAISSGTDLKAFLARLTPRIESGLAAWFGSQARLAGPPEFRPRPWSYFFRYPVRTAGLESGAALVKIRHTENMTVAEASVDGRMKGEMRDEYESLGRIRSIYGHEGKHKSFFTIRPLALLDDLNALVMEEADIRTLRDVSQAPGMWTEGRARDKFRAYMELTGSWIRTYHNQSRESADGPFFDAEQYEAARRNWSRIAAGFPCPNPEETGMLLDALYAKHRDAALPYRTIHDNFSCANVFVTGDERICSFDPHNVRGPIYTDLAKFIGDLETSRIHMLGMEVGASISILRSFIDSFLRGYFRGEPVDESALMLHRLLFVLEKWGGEGSKILAPARGDNPVDRAIRNRLCQYYSGLLRGYVTWLGRQAEAAF